MLLFAQQVQDSFLNPNFFPHVFSSVIYFTISLLFLAIAFKVLDWITPGNLRDELLGNNSRNQPNIALAIVVGLYGLGLCIIIAMTLN